MPDEDQLRSRLNEKISEYHKANGALRYRIRDELVAETRGWVDHPDWYDGPCMCMECRSYGDDRFG